MNELAAQGTPDLFYLIFMIPPMLLAGWAQSQVKSRYMAARTMPASCTGAQAARRILDSSGLQNVRIEEIEGTLTDHYDPRTKVLRLSSDIYHGQTLAAVGIAAHEAGHAIQDATHYPLMVIRQMAVPMASIGGGAGMFDRRRRRGARGDRDGPPRSSPLLGGSDFSAGQPPGGVQRQCPRQTDSSPIGNRLGRADADDPQSARCRRPNVRRRDALGCHAGPLLCGPAVCRLSAAPPLVGKET